MSHALLLLLLFALTLIGAPIALITTGGPLDPISTGIMVSSGVVLSVLCAMAFTVTRLYVKTKASEAFVRTGMGGMRVIRDGGALVLPVVHQIVRVSLQTIRLEVARTGVAALITQDKLRADIKAEFFVRVLPEDEAIKAAARSLGEKMTAPESVSQLIEDKLVSALRTAAARKTLEQLNSERDEFLREVMSLVTSDLTHNGFTLETVTISMLDQTDEGNLKENNIFDAQGMRTIAEITQRNLTERNKILRDGEQARTAQDVDTRRQVLELERARAEAEAAQAAQVAIMQAEQGRQTKEKMIEAQRAVEIAEVERKKQIEVARRMQEREVEIAEQEKLRAVVDALQKVEVARRAQEEAVARAEAQKAGAEAKLAEAEAERERARQQVTTVEQLAEADREKQKAVIGAEAEAEQRYVQTQKAADGEAYRVRAEADARKASADAEAEAIQKRAVAEAEAKRQTAEGDKAVALAGAEAQKAAMLAEAEGRRAIEMVPVDVMAREVEVERRRVEEVLKPELEAREKSGRVAQDFELARIRIEKEAEVRVAAANATVNLYNKISANVFGTPEDVARMAESFSSGMGFAKTLDGFLAAASPETLAVAAKVADVAASLGSAAADRVRPQPSAASLRVDERELGVSQPPAELRLPSDTAALDP